MQMCVHQISELQLWHQSDFYDIRTYILNLGMYCNYVRIRDFCNRYWVSNAEKNVFLEIFYEESMHKISFYSF